VDGAVALFVAINGYQAVISLQSWKTCVLAILALEGGISTGSSAPPSAQDFANMDAQRDVAATHGFLLDTNRTIPILFIVGDSTVHNPQKIERGWGDVIGKFNFLTELKPSTTP